MSPRSNARSPNTRGYDRPALGFALAKALEDQDRFADAFAVLDASQRAAPRAAAWEAAAIRPRGRCDRRGVRGPAAARRRPTFGDKVIFIVSLPRAGSTLVEQILAAHPEVEGAGELPDLSIVIDEESRRRGAPFPAWVRDAEAADWHRLGERYLERTARWRTRRPRFTDKSLLNGPYVGAAAAMLPGARFVDCRRDPVETALSCYRQWFAQGQAWSYAIDDIAAHSARPRSADGALAARACRRLYARSFTKTLLADPEASVRALLDFCGLAIRCRAASSSTEANASVRTASAAQVRQPLRRDTGRADRYGALLDPLRRALASRSSR